MKFQFEMSNFSSNSPNANIEKRKVEWKTKYKSIFILNCIFILIIIIIINIIVISHRFNLISFVINWFRLCLAFEYIIIHETYMEVSCFFIFHLSILYDSIRFHFHSSSSFDLLFFFSKFLSVAIYIPHHSFQKFT